MGSASLLRNIGIEASLGRVLVYVLCTQNNGNAIHIEQLRGVFRHVHGECDDVDALFDMYASRDDGLLHRPQFDKLATDHPEILAAAVQSLWARFHVPTPRDAKTKGSPLLS